MPLELIACFVEHQQIVVTNEWPMWPLFKSIHSTKF